MAPRKDIFQNVLGEAGITSSDTRNERGAFRYLLDNPIAGYSRCGGHTRVGKINARPLMDLMSSPTRLLRCI